MSVKIWEARKVLHFFILHLACMRWYCSIHSYFEIALFSFYFNSSSVILVLIFSVLQLILFQLVAKVKFLCFCLIFIFYFSLISINIFNSFVLVKNNNTIFKLLYRYLYQLLYCIQAHTSAQHPDKLKYCMHFYFKNLRMKFKCIFCRNDSMPEPNVRFT